MLIRANRDGHAGALNPNWGGGPATIDVRASAGRPVTAHRRNGGKRARFCSSECYGKWMHEHKVTNNKRIMPEMADLADRYNSGMNAQQVAGSYGVSRSYVMTEMRKRGIPLRPQGGFRPRSLPGSQ